MKTKGIHVAKLDIQPNDEISKNLLSILFEYPKHHATETNAYNVPGICNILNFHR